MKWITCFDVAYNRFHVKMYFLKIRIRILTITISKLTTLSMMGDHWLIALKLCEYFFFL